MEEDFTLIDNSDPTANAFYQISGRISRQDLWKSLWKYFSYIITVYYFFLKLSSAMPPIAVLFLIISVLFVRYFMCAAFCKRFHDINCSAALPLTFYGLEVFVWWLYLYLLFQRVDACLYFFVAGLVIMVADTLLQLGITLFYPPSPGMNRYGSNPQRDFDEQVQECEQMLEDDADEAPAKQADEDMA